MMQLLAQLDFNNPATLGTVIMTLLGGISTLFYLLDGRNKEITIDLKSRVAAMDERIKFLEKRDDEREQTHREALIAKEKELRQQSEAHQTDLRKWVVENTLLQAEIKRLTGKDIVP